MAARCTLDFAYAQNNVTYRLIAVQIQAELRAVGIDARLKGYNGAMMFAGRGPRAASIRAATSISPGTR